MSPAARVVAQQLAAAFQALGALAKYEPAEADAIAQQVVAHLRSSRPLAFQLDTAPVPRV